MKELYAILRSGLSTNRGTDPQTPLPVSLEVDLLDPWSANRTRRMDGVRAVMPAMPMKLIRPLFAEPISEPSIAWGL
jgi:hypothetical protein